MNKVPAAGAMRVECPIEAIDVQVYTVPTKDAEESDGTLKWKSTTMVLVEVRAADCTGIGYTYADGGAAAVIKDMLSDVLMKQDAMQTAARYADMYAKIRNNGREGLTSMAVSALDIALWDLKGKILNAPVSVLFGAARAQTPVYGSGGFTSYSIEELTEQLGGWVHQMNIPRVKMKIGRDPERDPERVASARKAIGSGAQLFVDANGAYSRKQALEMARHFAEQNVCWYEEPVYHNDLEGNRIVREHAPPVMEISNGEYGFAPYNFAQILHAQAADVLQADVTRCGGYSGFIAVDGLCEAYMVPLSSHCAPYVTLPVACAAKMLRHVEYFYDHVRIERMFFEGTPDPENGCMAVDRDQPGIGLEFKRQDAQRYAV